MKKIGFIGAYDKTDLLLNIAKILTTMNNRTLIIDSTINQKAKYVVPAIDPTISYITLSPYFNNPHLMNLGISFYFLLNLLCFLQLLFLSFLVRLLHFRL